MTTRHRGDCPHYVAPATAQRHRVTLTTELSWSGQITACFLGEFQEEDVVVQVYDVADVIAIRRALAEHGLAVYDSFAWRVELATRRLHADSKAAELVRRRSAVRAGKAGGATDGALR